MVFLDKQKGEAFTSNVDVDGNRYYVVAVFPEGGSQYTLEGIFELETHQSIYLGSPLWGKIEAEINENEELHN